MSESEASISEKRWCSFCYYCTAAICGTIMFAFTQMRGCSANDQYAVAQAKAAALEQCRAELERKK